MKDIIFKSVQIKTDEAALKKLAKGEISVVFATMGVWDKDGDLARPGFYGEQQVVMVPAHDWSHVPIGKGKTYEAGNNAVADIKLNLELQAAKDWLAAMKFDLENGKPLMEFSYGFKVLDGGSQIGEELGRRGRILTPRDDGSPGAKIWEVSPVLVGAGEKTRILSAKSAEGKKFCDEVDEVHDAVSKLVDRAKSLADLRASEDRDMSPANKERLAGLADSLNVAAKSLVGLITPAVVEPSAAETAARKELMRMMQVRAGTKQ